MGFVGEDAILRGTMTDAMTLYRESVSQNSVVRKVVYQGLPCALSRSAHTASPAPMGFGAVIPESRYRMSLFMPAGTVTRLGDRVEIRRGSQIFFGTTSDSVGYESHSVCVADIREVSAHD